MPKEGSQILEAAQRNKMAEERGDFDRQQRQEYLGEFYLKARVLVSSAKERELNRKSVADATLSIPLEEGLTGTITAWEYDKDVTIGLAYYPLRLRIFETQGFLQAIVIEESDGGHLANERQATRAEIAEFRGLLEHMEEAYHAQKAVTPQVV